MTIDNLPFSDELIDVLRKNLPEHANQSIINTINENERLQQLVEDQQNRIERLENSIKSKDATIASATAENKKLQGLVKTEEELVNDHKKLVRDAERIELTILQAKYEALDKSKEEIKELVSKVFRNPVLIKRDSVPVPENYTRYDESHYNSMTGNYEARQYNETNVVYHDKTTTEEIE